jgi:hypothetical protein
MPTYEYYIVYYEDWDPVPDPSANIDGIPTNQTDLFNPI